jgi:galactose mutarotase-like enzyme
MTSHTLHWDHGSASILSTAAMLADCTFLLDCKPFSPFARAPWMGTVQDPTIIGHLRELGGDFVGIPFGGSGPAPDAPAEWAALMHRPRLPVIHGPSGDADWTVTSANETAVTLSLDYPADSPVERLERTIAARPDAPALDFTLVIHARRAAQISVGLHPIFRLPEHSGDLVLSADFAFGLVHPRQTAPGHPQEFSDLAAVPQNGTAVDLSRPPLQQPNLNVQLCGMRGPSTAHYVADNAGIILDWDRTLLPSLQIWHTDRGIDGPPWHGQYRGLGLEPIAAAFDLHDAVSTAPNPINSRGVATSISIHPDKPVVIRHSVEAFTPGAA